MVPAIQGSPEPIQGTSQGYSNGSWGYRDVAMFSTQGVSGLGALATFMLGGWNTASPTPDSTNSTQHPTLGTVNSYGLLACGIFFTLATIVQAASHYHWRQDIQKAKNGNFSDLINDLEKGLQQVEQVAAKIEAFKQARPALSQPQDKGAQPLAGQGQIQATEDKNLRQIKASDS